MKRNKRSVFQAHFIVKVVGMLMLGAFVVGAVGFVVYMLWNALMPEIFGLKTIGYGQSVGLLILARILFGGIGSDSSSGNRKWSRSSKAAAAEVCDPSEKLYDRWWDKEGASAFEAFLKSSQQRPEEEGARYERES